MEALHKTALILLIITIPVTLATCAVFIAAPSIFRFILVTIQIILIISQYNIYQGTKPK